MSRRPSADRDSHRAQWIKNRFKLNDAIRRAPDVSANAYRVWAELAFGWAWDAPSCFPNYDILAEALHCHRNTVARVLTELVGHGLIERHRRKRGYHYALVIEIPEKFWTETLNNKSLVKEVRGRKSSKVEDDDAPSVVHHEEVPGDIHDAPSVVHHEGHDAPPVVHHIGHDAPPVVHHIKADEHPDEADEHQKKQTKMRAPSAPASEAPQDSSFEPSRCALGNEGTQANDRIETYNDMNDTEGLMEDPFAGEAKPRRRVTRKKRSSDKTFVPTSGREGVPFPDLMGSSQSHDLHQFDLGPPPPPVESPEDLLELLRGEIEGKYGTEATRGLPMELSRVLRGQIRNTIIRKYPPDVILAMVRLLVWDWEVARKVCFPFRHDVPYPDPLALVQYTNALAVRITTGFDYTSAKRGSLNTYQDLFIKKLARVDDSDPTWG